MSSTPSPPLPSPLSFYALTRAGAVLAGRIAAAFSGRVHAPARFAAEVGAEGFASFSGRMAEEWGRCRGHVVIGAAGAAVRAIAPLARDKALDPAVVVMDAGAENVISLLSGHLGGANDLARAIAGFVGGRAVITTGTDAAGAPAAEVLAARLGLGLEGRAGLKLVNATLAEGGRVPVFDPLGLFTPEAGEAGYFEWLADPADLPPEGPGLAVDWRVWPEARGLVFLRPSVLAVGVGCRRGAGEGEILAHIRAVFAERRLAMGSLAVLASIEAKRDEPGIVATAGALGVSCRFFSAMELGRVPVPHPSEVVRRRMGVEGVCEASAMLAAGTRRLVVGKTSSGRVTVAVALAV